MTNPLQAITDMMWARVNVHLPREYMVRLWHEHQQWLNRGKPIEDVKVD